MDQKFKEKEVDWEELRIQSAINNLPECMRCWTDSAYVARMAVVYADALIKELKK